MVAEVSVQSSNFAADTPFGPVVISTISKSGGERFHGEAYFDARNSALNANDWTDNHNGIGQGQHYYYPGNVSQITFRLPIRSSSSGVVMRSGCRTRRRANVLKSFIPTPEMMAGDFTTDNADNQALCPNRFVSATTSSYPTG